MMDAGSNGDMDDGRVAYKWKVLGSVIFGVFMVVLDMTAVNVAFQTVRAEYGARLSDAQWIISLYVLAIGVATPLAGYLADRFGIKRTYIGGLVTFAIGSLLCGLAPDLPSLIAARALQGFGGGMAVPLGSALLLRAFPAGEQGRALGLYGVAIVFAPMIGPVLGGVLVDLGFWRWIFFINVPIGAAGVLLASRLLREERSPHDHRLDVFGLITVVIGVGAILYATTVVETSGWRVPGVALWFGVGGTALVAFTVTELFVAREPLLDLRLFRHPTFLIASLVGYVTIVSLFGAEFLMPLYLQAARGLSAMHTGLIMLPMAIAAGIFTPLAGHLYDRIGPRMLLVTGFSLLAINTWNFARLDATTPIAWICALLAIRGAALGLTTQTTFVTAMSVVSGSALPRGTSLVNASRNVVHSLGVAVLATLAASTLSPRTRVIQAEANTEAVAGVCAIGDDSSLARGPWSEDEMRVACDESIAGFELAYTLSFVAALVALGLGVALPGWPAAWSGRTALAGPPQPGG
jgi:DHA2 family multidrug resistance protein